MQTKHRSRRTDQATNPHPRPRQHRSPAHSPSADRFKSQDPVNAAGQARRGSAQPNSTLLERPPLQARTISAPLSNARARTDRPSAAPNNDHVDYSSSEEGLTEQEARDFAQASVGALDLGQEEHEVAGTVRHFPPYQPSTPVAQEINIAVIGAHGVGKSTFVQRALQLPVLPSSPTAEAKVPIEGSVYLVRLLELLTDDVDIDDDDDTISWPDKIESRVMPDIDGALFLYDVGDQASLEWIPEMLRATNKAALPSLLIACKCDKSDAEREVDPTDVELKARRSINGLSTLQTSRQSADNHKRALSMMLKSIIFGSADYEARYASSPRPRAQSSAVRAFSPQPRLHSHSRASSEHTGISHIDKNHGRHDSSLARYGSSDRLKVPQYESQEGNPVSFLLEESGSDGSKVGSARSSFSAASPGHDILGNAPSSAASTESGVTFEELIARLLAQPTSKADSKFAAIFLALYRTFAAPGRLLETIIERFEALEQSAGAQMIRTVSQLRYLSILEQWVCTYRGDFAYPRTKSRMRTFTGKLFQSRIFNVAAKEMSTHLDMVQEDDDTNWAFTDKARETGSADQTAASPASTMLPNDSSFEDQKGVGGNMLREDSSGSLGDTLRSALASSTSAQLLYNIDAAQKQAATLVAVPRLSLSKIHWRMLMEKPDDLMARELTRMDWVMFSSIRPRDLVRLVCLPSAERAKCKNTIHVDRMSEHFNRLACWVSNFILLRDKPKHRAIMLEKIMRIARQLRDLNNYNSLGAIIAGIKSSPVHRLAATRNLIPDEVGRDWLKLEILMAPSRSHSAYRLAWENSTQERIPYFPLVRRDLVHAAENKTFIEEPPGTDGEPAAEKKINWRKLEIMGEVIVGLQRAQGMPYRDLLGVRADPEVRELLLDVRLESEEDNLYDRSVQCEPPSSNLTVANAGAKFKDFFKRQANGLGGS